MSDTVPLIARDLHSLGAYIVEPEGKPRGALVVVQEIFGVNDHIRSVAEGYARDGYLAIAPALFDRAERNVELGYQGPDRERGIALKGASSNDNALLDLAAAIAHGAPAGKVGDLLGRRLDCRVVVGLEPEPDLVLRERCHGEDVRGAGRTAPAPASASFEEVYSVMLVTTPEPTVRPPSRIAKRRPWSMAIGWISSIDMVMLSPGMTISVPSGRLATPVTSVVRK